MTEKNLLDKILSALYGADEPKLAGQLKEYVADKEDELIAKFSVLAAEALHRLEQYEKEITDYRGLFKYFLYNFKEQGTPLKLFTTDKYQIEDIIAKYPEHSPISEYAPNYKTTKTAIDNDRGDDHNYSYMEPPPKKELDDKYVTKEAILERCCLRKDGSTVYAKEDILNAMQEYAKEQCSNLAAEYLNDSREDVREKEWKSMPNKDLKIKLSDLRKIR